MPRDIAPTAIDRAVSAMATAAPAIVAAALDDAVDRGARAILDAANPGDKLRAALVGCSTTFCYPGLTVDRLADALLASIAGERRRLREGHWTASAN